MKCRDSSRQVRNSRKCWTGSGDKPGLSPPPFLPPLPSPPMGPVEQKPQSLPESNKQPQLRSHSHCDPSPVCCHGEFPSPGRAPAGWRQGVPWVEIGGHIPRIQQQRKAIWETGMTNTEAQRWEAARTRFWDSPSSKGPRL